MTNKRLIPVSFGFISSALSIGSMFVTTAGAKIGLLAAGGVFLGAATIVFIMSFQKTQPCNTNGE